MTTFAALLDRWLRADAGRPLVTFYDGRSGERTELSVATYATWVAKVSSLLSEELDVERGSRVRVDLPPHWLGPIVVGAVWTVGARLTRAEDPDLAVCGPDGLVRWDGSSVPVLASALQPLGGRFAAALPPGVVDLGAEVWSHPDVFVPWDAPTGSDAAWDATYDRHPVDEEYAGPGRAEDHEAPVDRTQGRLWSAAAAGSLLADGGRLLTDANPASPPGVASFAEPFARGGSLVLVTGLDAAAVERTATAERVTARDLGHPARS